MLLIWLIGWLFTLGVTGVDNFWVEMKMLATWPVELGKIARENLK